MPALTVLKESGQRAVWTQEEGPWEALGNFKGKQQARSSVGVRDEVQRESVRQGGIAKDSGFYF